VLCRGTHHKWCLLIGAIGPFGIECMTGISRPGVGLQSINSSSRFGLLSINQPNNLPKTFAVLGTHQGTQQSLTANLGSLNETSHSMLFQTTERSKFCGFGAH